MYKFTSFSLYFSFFLSVSAFFHVYFFTNKFFLKFSSDYWGGKKGVLPPHPNYFGGGACPGCPPRVYAYEHNLQLRTMSWHHRLIFSGHSTNQSKLKAVCLAGDV